MLRDVLLGVYVIRVGHLSQGLLRLKLGDRVGMVLHLGLEAGELIIFVIVWVLNPSFKTFIVTDNLVAWLVTDIDISILLLAAAPRLRVRLRVV